MRTLVLGIGNPLLQDDRAGIAVAEALEERKLPIDTAILYCVGFEVLDAVQGYEQVLVVDAAQLGNAPGTVLEVGLEDIFSEHSLSHSHAITLGATLKTGYVLFPEDMPKTLRIFLIEAENPTAFSTVCSEPVQKAIDELVERLSGELGRPALDEGLSRRSATA
jgi:hydrogenase maturation protease